MRRLPACPACGPVELHPVCDGEQLNFYCVQCGTCWHIELGFVSRVDPATCPGCQIELICHARAPAMSRAELHRTAERDYR